MFKSIEKKMEEAGHEIGDRFVNEDGEEFMYSVSDFNHGEYAPVHFLVSLEPGDVRRLFNDIPECKGFEAV